MNMAMRRIEAGGLGAGQTTRELLWRVPVAHLTNYSSERVSSADHSIGDNFWLSGRPLVALTRGDRVVCSTLEAAIHRDMVRYHNQIGVSTLRPEDIIGIPSSSTLTPICTDAVQLMRQDPAAVAALFGSARMMVPLIVSPGSVILGRRHNLVNETTAQAVNIANNKKYLPEAAQNFGFLTPPTRKPNNIADAEVYFRELMQLAADSPAAFDKKVWMKLCRSSGGEGVKSFTSITDFLYWISSESGPGADFRETMISRKHSEGIVLQIGAKARAKDAAPNINFFVGETEEQDRFLGESAQAISNGSFHVGNYGELDARDVEKMQPVVNQVSNWLRSIGFRGVCGIDVIMGADGRVWVIDINARWNASTSTVMLYNNLRDMPGVKAFRYSGKVRALPATSVNDFVTHLDKSGISFDPSRGGVIPINLMTANRPGSPAENAYVQVAIFGPSQQAVSEFFDASHMR